MEVVAGAGPKDGIVARGPGEDGHGLPSLSFAPSNASAPAIPSPPPFRRSAGGNTALLRGAGRPRAVGVVSD
jgi:hypothetical protein